VVKTERETAEMRSVSVGLTQGNLAAITNGLAPGELVVTDGQDKLQNNSKVDYQMGGGGPKGKSGAGSQSGTPQSGARTSRIADSGTPASS
jgi:multidrug efflux system membrane fusion protein